MPAGENVENFWPFWRFEQGFGSVFASKVEEMLPIAGSTGGRKTLDLRAVFHALSGRSPNAQRTAPSASNWVES